MSIKSIAAAALVLCAGAAQAATVNGFANGGFETVGTTTAAASWLAGAAGYSRSTDAHTGSFSALLASPAFNAAVMLQNSKEQGALPNLTVGDIAWQQGIQDVSYFSQLFRHHSGMSPLQYRAAVRGKLFNPEVAPQP